jgi:post-segregation antitoxin (ccd killing protein)
MTRVNIYLPRELAESAREADINVSAIAQEALELELRRRSLLNWLEEVGDLPALTDALMDDALIHDDLMPDSQ